MVKLSSLEKRVIEIKYKRKDAWVGSCLTAVNIIDRIFRKKKADEKFILSSGHAGTALYAVLEKYGIIDGSQAESFISHPHLDPKHGIFCSTGSLGHGIGVALGMALSNRRKNVYVLLTDGECAEGSVWETLAIMKERKVVNLKVHININGYGGYGDIDVPDLFRRLRYYIPINQIHIAQQKIVTGLSAHYAVVTKEFYEKIIR